MAKPESSRELQSLKMLYEEFPPIYETKNKEKYVTTVRETQSTVMELGTLGCDIKMELLQRAARRRPLCHVRKDILDQTAREILRQLIIECPERAVLFKKCIQEAEKTFEAIEVLLHFNDAFMCRKYLKAMHIASEQNKKIRELEETNKILKRQVSLLKTTAEQLERKHADEKTKGELVRKQQLQFYRTLGEQLKAQLDAAVTPEKEQ
ncbi:Axonemal dynein light intermediate polypeptide 1 [Sparganum proliferum]